MEAIILISSLLANALFILTRHCAHQQNSLRLMNSGHHAETDFLESKQVEIGLISAWVTQLATSVFLDNHANIYPEAHFDKLVDW